MKRHLEFLNYKMSSAIELRKKMSYFWVTNSNVLVEIQTFKFF